jgi:hypothetical protein
MRISDLVPSAVLADVYGFDYSCITDIALRAPFVDAVDFKSVVTDPCVIKVRDFHPGNGGTLRCFIYSLLIFAQRRKKISHSMPPSL